MVEKLLHVKKKTKHESNNGRILQSSRPERELRMMLFFFLTDKILGKSQAIVAMVTLNPYSSSETCSVQ